MHQLNTTYALHLHYLLYQQTKDKRKAINYNIFKIEKIKYTKTSWVKHAYYLITFIIW